MMMHASLCTATGAAEAQGPSAHRVPAAMRLIATLTLAALVVLAAGAANERGLAGAILASAIRASYVKAILKLANLVVLTAGAAKWRGLAGATTGVAMHVTRRTTKGDARRAPSIARAAIVQGLVDAILESVIQATRES